MSWTQEPKSADLYRYAAEQVYKKALAETPGARPDRPAGSCDLTCLYGAVSDYQHAKDRATRAAALHRLSWIAAALVLTEDGTPVPGHVCGRAVESS